MTTKPTSPTSAMTLAEALEHTYRTRWAHARDGGKCLYSQAKAAMIGLTGWHNVEHARVVHSGRSATAAFFISEDTEVRMVPPGAVTSATARWYSMGLSPATITKRLNCLSAMGVPVSGMRPPKERNLKWWLRPEEEERALDWLEAQRTDDMLDLGDFIRFTTKTGLRIEETLRLTRKDFNADFTEITVPGTKTASSQASLPLGELASIVASAHFFSDASPEQPMWADPSYAGLEAAWRKLRTAMGWPQAATLKALRRSAARYLHVDCGMPLHMVQQYLRHENIQTTLDYLRLTGGYGTEEMRRYLK